MYNRKVLSPVWPTKVYKIAIIYFMETEYKPKKQQIHCLIMDNGNSFKHRKIQSWVHDLNLKYNWKV